MVLDPLSFQSTVLVAVILAAAARTIIPYLAKRQADIQNGVAPRPFTFSYVITAFLGSVPVFVGAIMLLPIVLPQVSNEGTQLMVFVTAFGLAYATTDLVNRNLPTSGVLTPLVRKQVLAQAQEEAEAKRKAEDNQKPVLTKETIEKKIDGTA